MGRMIATPKTANRLVFCQYAVCSLLFLTIFGAKPFYFVFSIAGRSGHGIYRSHGNVRNYLFQHFDEIF